MQHPVSSGGHSWCTSWTDASDEVAGAFERKNLVKNILQDFNWFFKEEQECHQSSMHILNRSTWKKVKSAPKIFRCVETKENGDLEMCGKRNP
jgi:hypothetical protein